MRALNDDSDKLISETPATEPEVRRLQQEMRRCNDAYAALAARLHDAESPMAANARQLVATLERLKSDVTRTDQEVTARMREPLSRDRAEFAVVHAQQQQLERQVSALENEVETAQAQFHQLPAMQRSKPEVQSKLSALVDKWSQLRAQEKLYAERTDALGELLKKLDALTDVADHCEQTLTSHDSLSADAHALQETKRELDAALVRLRKQQPEVDSLATQMLRVTQLSARSRPGLTRQHSDLRGVEQRVDDVTSRWDAMTANLQDRYVLKTAVI